MFLGRGRIRGEVDPADGQQAVRIGWVRCEVRLEQDLSVPLTGNQDVLTNVVRQLLGRGVTRRNC
jgi:hypothetical protein